MTRDRAPRTKNESNPQKKLSELSTSDFSFDHATVKNELIGRKATLPSGFSRDISTVGNDLLRNGFDSYPVGVDMQTNGKEYGTNFEAAINQIHQSLNHFAVEDIGNEINEQLLIRKALAILGFRMAPGMELRDFAQGVAKKILPEHSSNSFGIIEDYDDPQLFKIALSLLLPHPQTGQIEHVRGFAQQVVDSVYWEASANQVSTSAMGVSSLLGRDQFLSIPPK
jgi:hypothetical protein